MLLMGMSPAVTTVFVESNMEEPKDWNVQVCACGVLFMLLKEWTLQTPNGATAYYREGRTAEQCNNSNQLKMQEQTFVTS